jgi:phage tail-like protein
MRGLIDGLIAPASLIGALPGIYQEDELAAALSAAFDEVLAPIVSTIDNLPSYLDPALTPDDFLDWLAGWVAVEPDETWPLERRRALVALASHLHQMRGTSGALAMQLRLLVAGEVEVTDSGGASWSSKPGSKPPGDASYQVTVHIKPAKKATIDALRVNALVAAAKPAHVSHVVEIGERAAG